MDGPSIYCVIKKTFLFFIQIQWNIENYNFTIFHWIQMKKKKVF